MLKISTFLVILHLQNAQCSLVIDSLSQKGVFLSDYCPKMKYCAEGAHVMCMYYNPNHMMGPRCNRPKNVSITPDLADKLLEVSNAVRSKIALGKEKGKGGDVLPKGYGMFRLKWDNELATFAQVLANQCVLRHDMCRATKRFADPGQTAGLVRFTYPEWFPVSKAGHFTKPGLTASKLSYAITQTLKSWYGQKDAVTSSMITSYPDWAENPNNQAGRLYLEMIYGPATHMGCGISAYTEYAYYDNNAALNYNSVQVICNYSSRPRKGGSVYQVEPPSEVGYTVRCGCPVGMDEDADCLCYESQRNEIKPPSFGRSCSENGHCKPAVVLLPIFTVENAPQDKLTPSLDISSFNKQETEVEISDMYQPVDNTTVLHPLENIPQTNIQNVIGNIINDGTRNDQLTSLLGSLPVQETPPPQLPPSPPPKPLPVTELPKALRMGYGDYRYKEPQSVISSLVNEVRRNVDYKGTTPHFSYAIPHKPVIHDVPKRVFGKHPQPVSRYRPNPIRPTFNRLKPRKTSVFTKVAKFQLPKLEERSIQMDVKPRKDFSNVKNLVQDYLHFKNDPKDSRNIFSVHDHLYEHKEEEKRFNFQTTTEKILDSAEEKVINSNYYFKNVTRPINKRPKFDTNGSKETNDKLMTLLNRLEQEVKHIDMDRNKKEIFDAKIRKIYGTVVGEAGLLDYKTDHESDFTEGELTDFVHNRFADLDLKEPEGNRFSDLEGKSHMKKLHHKTYIEELEKNVENIHEKYSDIENELRPLSRSQNSLYMDKITQLNPRNVKKAKTGYESDTKHGYTDVGEIKASMRKGIFSTNNDIKIDHIYNDKDVLRARNVFSDIEDKKKTRKFKDEDDPLSVDRRRFYQTKLENLERKLHSARSFKHHKDNNNREIRPILPAPREEHPIRHSKSHPEPFYMPERARFLHGF